MVKIQVNSQGKAFLTTDGKALEASGDKFGADINSWFGTLNEQGILQRQTKQTDLVFTGVKEFGVNSCRYLFANNYIKSIEFPDLETFSQSNACANMFNGVGPVKSVTFPKLVSITAGGPPCLGMFANSSIETASFPVLKTLSGNQCCNQMFLGAKLKSVDISAIETISSQFACIQMFGGSSNLLTSLSFDSLTTLTGQYALRQIVLNSRTLKDMYFPSLKSTSFGSRTDQFSLMLNGVTGCTVHFPSNLQSVIGSWADVTAGFGGANTIVLFDLAETE